MLTGSFKKLSVLLSVFPLVSLAQLNDWTKPCLQGECSYDIPEHQGSGSVRIWGSPDAISDITEAAGWAIVGCDAKAVKQNIRLVCLDNAVCGHLYQSRGPVNKIVRLPESCGKNAFARIAKEWVSEDQTIPDSIARRLPNGKSLPKVKALTLDTDFSKIDPSQTGKVSFSLQGVTIPGFKFSNPPPKPDETKRGSLGWWDDLNHFDKNVSKDLAPIDISKDYPLFSQSFTCGTNPTFTATIGADANVHAHAQLAIGAAASGTFVPPHFDKFGLYVGIYSATIQGIVDLKASVSGSADSGVLTLWEQSLAGLDIAGILTLGPVFKVTAQASASLNVDADVALDVSYSIENAQLFYPPSGAPASGGNAWPSGSPVHLSVTPSVAGSAAVNANITPRIDVGIDALGVASAHVFLDLVASGNLNANLAASAANSASGCVTAGVEVNMHAGANADLFGLWDPSTQVTLFDKQFPLLNKCFGSGARTTTPAARGLHALERRGWTCPTVPTSALVSVA